MSTILWKKALVPPPTEAAGALRWDDYGDALSVPGALRFAAADADLVDLPDPRAYRSLSRAGLLLAACGLPAREALAPLVEADPHRVGLYAAIEWGPNDYASARRMVDTPPEHFAADYKAFRSAKQYFKMLPNVPAAQLAIFLGVRGPLTVFNHSRLGALHALDQAEEDLVSGRVDAALVCSAFSLEDPLLAARARRSAGSEAVLSEGAACLLLGPNGERTDRAAQQAPGGHAYGIATDLVLLALRSEPDDRSGAVRARRERDQGRAQHRRPVDLTADVAQPGPGR